MVVAPVVLVLALGVGVVVYVYSSLTSSFQKERAQIGQLTFRPCPPPTTCTGSLTVMSDPRAFCVAPPSATAPPFVSGDAVYVRDGSVVAFAHLSRGSRSGTFQAERLTGYKLEVTAKDVFGRACKP